MKFETVPSTSSLESSDNESDFEVIKEWVEGLNTKSIIRCLEKHKQEAVSIGAGMNAEVFALNSGEYKGICVKEMYQNQELPINSLSVEVDFQEKMLARGINAPSLLMEVEDIKNNKKYILMERIMGPSLKNVLEEGYQLPENFDYDVFFSQLEKEIKTMNEGNLMHRDLHSGNVMISEEGLPVIIDFGAMGYVFEEDKKEELVYKMNPVTKLRERIVWKYKTDEESFQKLKEQMKIYK